MDDYITVWHGPVLGEKLWGLDAPEWGPRRRSPVETGRLSYLWILHEKTTSTLTGAKISTMASRPLVSFSGARGDSQQLQATATLTFIQISAPHFDLPGVSGPECLSQTPFTLHFPWERPCVGPCYHPRNSALVLSTNPKSACCGLHKTGIETNDHGRQPYTLFGQHGCLIVKLLMPCRRSTKPSGCFLPMSSPCSECCC